MNGAIVNFRRSRHSQKFTHLIIKPEGVSAKDKAEALVGKDVTWKNPKGKNKIEIKGKIASVHGNKGCVRVIFEKGLPGQALGTKVQIL